MACGLRIVRRTPYNKSLKIDRVWTSWARNFAAGLFRSLRAKEAGGSRDLAPMAGILVETFTADPAT